MGGPHKKYIHVFRKSHLVQTGKDIPGRGADKHIVEQLLVGAGSLVEIRDIVAHSITESLADCTQHFPV